MRCRCSTDNTPEECIGGCAYLCQQLPNGDIREQSEAVVADNIRAEMAVAKPTAPGEG